MGFQMSEFEFQTFLFFFCPPPYLGKSPQFSRFLIMKAPLTKQNLSLAQLSRSLFCFFPLIFIWKQISNIQYETIIKDYWKQTTII